MCIRDSLDTVIVDTAGRTHIDADMMEEIQAVCSALNPAEVLLVVDAMTGQEAVNIASSSVSYTHLFSAVPSRPCVFRAAKPAS